MFRVIDGLWLISLYLVNYFQNIKSCNAEILTALINEIVPMCFGHSDIVTRSGKPNFEMQRIFYLRD